MQSSTVISLAVIAPPRLILPPFDARLSKKSISPDTIGIKYSY